MKVVAGVDCHKSQHTIAFITDVGALIKTVTIPTNDGGYEEAFALAASLGDTAWALEGTGSYGLAFAQFLETHGAEVYEVPGSFTKRHRRSGSCRGKSDANDARAIAEALLRERDRLPTFRSSDLQRAARFRFNQRKRLVEERVKAVNRLRDAALHAGIRALPKSLASTTSVQQVAAEAQKLLGRSIATDAAVEEILFTVDSIERIDHEIRRLQRLMRPFAEKYAPELLSIFGLSAIGVVGLIGHGGDMRNYRDANAFAMRCGTAPVPCSSGSSDRIRLNLGGNRQLNAILHMIASLQSRNHDHIGRAYYERKRAEGKTHKAALRALKRQLTTVVYYRLRSATERLQDAAAPLLAA